MKLLFTLVLTQTLLSAGFSQTVPNFNKKDRERAGLRGPVKSVISTSYHGDRKTNVVKSAGNLLGSTYEYSKSGNYISSSESNFKKKYTYDAKGRLVKVKQTSPKLNENYKDSIVWKSNIEYHYFRNSSWADKKPALTRYKVYDSLNRRIQEYYVNKEKVHQLESSWRYDDKFLISEVLYMGKRMAQESQWTYNEFDSIVEYRKYNSDSVLFYYIEYEYNDQKLKTKELCYDGKTNELVEIREFSYNDQKQLIKAFHNRLNSSSTIKEFVYDANSFLIRESSSLKGGTRSIDQVTTYANDKYGNPVKIEKYENDIKYMIAEIKYTYY